MKNEEKGKMWNEEKAQRGDKEKKTIKYRR